MLFPNPSLNLLSPRSHWPVALAALALSGAALATDDDIITLDTVAATGMQQWTEDEPASVSVITRAEIERKPVTSIADLLNDQPGVSGGHAASGAQSKISLRGLPEQYTLILVDGRRQGNSAGTHYRDDLGRQDLDWISPDMIERIEVIRGPMSSLYGADAMGGVINIITRKAGGHWKGTTSANYTGSTRDERGNIRQFGAHLSGPLGDDVSLRLGLGQTERQSDRPAKAGSKLSPGFRNGNADLLLSWRINDDHTLEVQGAYGVQKALDSGVLVNKDNCTPSAENNNCLTPTIGAWGAERLRHTGYGLYHEGRYGDMSSSNTSYNINRYINDGDPADSRSEEQVLESKFTTELNWGVTQALTAGAQFKHEELLNADTIGTVPAWDKKDTGQTPSPQNQADSWALFAEDHLSLLKPITLTLGLRADKTGHFDAHFSPRGYLLWHPNEHWTVRGGISHGYKAPDLKQGSAGAATMSKGRGCSALTGEGYVTGGCYMAGNPNLNPETSTNYEIGASFNRNGWQVSGTYFVTRFADKIEQAPLKDLGLPGFESSFVNGLWWTVAQNIEHARTRGLEASVHVPLHTRLQWVSNATRK